MRISTSSRVVLPSTMKLGRPSPMFCRDAAMYPAGISVGPHAPSAKAAAWADSIRVQQSRHVSTRRRLQ